MADRTRSSNDLRRVRAEHRLTLEELGDLTGLSAAMVSRVERGERRLAPLTRVRVARCLGVRVRDLFPVESAEEAIADVDAGVRP